MTTPNPDTATRARQLLDALPIQPPEWYFVRTYNKHVPDHWSVDVISDDDHVCSVRGRDEGAHALAELIAAAPTLIADLLAEHDRLTHWKAEGTEVIESWERVYDALGDVGGLGQRRSDAVLAEVLRMKAELDQRTDPDLATLLVKNADRYDKRFGWETPMGEQMRAAARKLGGEA